MSDAAAFPTFHYEQIAGAPDLLVAGVDEAGCGPLAGPVVAAAVILPHADCVDGLNDSKKLTAARREFLFEQLMERAKIGVGIASVEEIDEINILWASRLAMRRAVEALPEPPGAALVDGRPGPELSCKVYPIVRGDTLSLSIAAASIIAKVTRDRLMAELARDLPQYGWDRNQGYGTPAHLMALKEHGASIHHRRSFAPVRQVICGDLERSD